MAAALIVTALLFLCIGFLLGRFTNILKSEPSVPQISFIEPEIEAAVRSQLGLDEKAPLTSESLAAVRGLYIYGTEVYRDRDEYDSQNLADHIRGSIKTLEDLKVLPNLEELCISLQGDLDISELSQSKNLRHLVLKHMRITDIDPLTEIPMLDYVELWEAGVSDVSMLSELYRLDHLQIGFNPIQSMEQIGEFPYLHNLNIRGLKMDSLDGIESMINLEEISIANAEIADLSALRKLPKLTCIYASPDQIETLQSLFDGTNVEIIEYAD